MLNPGGLIELSALRGAIAYELPGQCVAPTAEELYDDSSVHTVHDFDHSELIEGPEVIRNVDDVAIGACRCHHHCQHQRVYSQKTAVHCRSHSELTCSLIESSGCPKFCSHCSQRVEMIICFGDVSVDLVDHRLPRGNLRVNDCKACETEGNQRCSKDNDTGGSATNFNDPQGWPAVRCRHS